MNKKESCYFTFLCVVFLYLVTLFLSFMLDLARTHPAICEYAKSQK
jgi:hypothetical protein